MKDTSSLLTLIPKLDRGSAHAQEWLAKLGPKQKEALERFLSSIEGMIDADIPFLHYFFIYCDPDAEHPLGINAIHGGTYTQPEDIVKLTRALLDGIRGLYRGSLNLTFTTAERAREQAETSVSHQTTEDILELDREFTERLLPLREQHGDEKLSQVINDVVRDLCTQRHQTFEEARASNCYAEFIAAVEWEVSKRLGHLTA